jgi:hypothetical protein
VSSKPNGAIEMINYLSQILNQIFILIARNLIIFIEMNKILFCGFIFVVGGFISVNLRSSVFCSIFSIPTLERRKPNGFLRFF